MQPNIHDQSRPSMMSVPARWRELYFNVFSALCILGELFLVWYEIYRSDAESDYLDIIMKILLDTGPVAMASAILAFIILKGRDAMLSTWETFARKRFEQGREYEREKQASLIEEEREAREALAKQLEEEREAREALAKQLEEERKARE